MLKSGFIVIEGTDGSGKREQVKKLVSVLKEMGSAVEQIDFPRYGEKSCFFVEQYLNGFYGTAEETGPYKPSIFFALDRFAASRDIARWIQEGKTVVADRYVASNLGHQGSKIPDENARRIFFEWDYNLEYELLGIPRPDLNIFLHVPADIAYDLVEKKEARSYIKGGGKRDIHEADIRHLRNAEKTYMEILKLFPEDFASVECVADGKLLTIEEIHKMVLEKVMELLRI